MRTYSSSAARFAAAETAAVQEELTVNFCTPHSTICANKVVDMVTLPGEAGIYAVSKGHGALISQLQPGVVTLTLAGGEEQQYVVSGGFAMTHESNITVGSFIVLHSTYF